MDTVKFPSDKYGFGGEVWTKKHPLHVDLDLNYKSDFTPLSHTVQKRWHYLKEQELIWDRLWRKGTNTNLHGLSWGQAMSYKEKVVAYKRPGSITTVPVELENFGYTRDFKRSCRWFTDIGRLTASCI